MPKLRHLIKDVSFVVLRGKEKGATYNDDGSVIEGVVFARRRRTGGVYSEMVLCMILEFSLLIPMPLNILKGIWATFSCDYIVRLAKDNQEFN